ncbi:hypothetical protein [Streptomyces sp. NBC_01262]|uniref:hypothetical protein n=1 Tax=Streptomyces sp. NBC_01262 TaxID=2903803 RepID=UPI002E2F54BE|nr:hypothetical protein [Streptomyces sp. NBC_01262]
MTAEHLRLYFEVDDTVTGPPDQLLGKVRAPDPAIRAAVLAPRRLRELYVTERKNSVEIADMAKCAATTVRDLLTLDGIPLRIPHPESAPPESLRAWLEREHVERRRPIRELAREGGMSTRDLSRKARLCGITIHPPGPEFDGQSTREVDNRWAISRFRGN